MTLLVPESQVTHLSLKTLDTRSGIFDVIVAITSLKVAGFDCVVAIPAVADQNKHFCLTKQKRQVFFVFHPLRTATIGWVSEQVEPKVLKHLTCLLRLYLSCAGCGCGEHSKFIVESGRKPKRFPTQPMIPVSIALPELTVLPRFHQVCWLPSKPYSVLREDNRQSQQIHGSNCSPRSNDSNETQLALVVFQNSLQEGKGPLSWSNRGLNPVLQTQVSFVVQIRGNPLWRILVRMEQKNRNINCRLSLTWTFLPRNVVCFPKNGSCKLVLKVLRFAGDSQSNSRSSQNSSA